ncbi:MAG: CvpA family protein [Clostridia bacterium]|nr:CvpA family protein [Clostridia bacterium]
MIIAIDLILGLTILVSIIVGVKQGFIRSVVGFLRFIIAYIVANAFYPTAAALARKLIGIESPETGGGKTGIIQFIKSLPENMASADTDTARAIFASAMFEIASFLLIFFVTVLLIKFIVWIIEKSSHVPGLSFANRFLGGVFGVFCGLLWAWILASLFTNYLLDYLVGQNSDLFYPEMRDNFLLKFCARTNPLTYLFSAVDALASLFQL